MSAILLKPFPKLLRSLVAKFVTFGNRMYYSKCAQLLERSFKTRISAYLQDPLTMFNDYAEWSIINATKHDNPVEKTPDMLSRRLMTLNFAAIHTSTMTTANMIMDIASGPQGRNCLNAIMTECQALRQKYGNRWNSARIAEMVVTDSALRESMRISGFGSKAFSRKVVAPGGAILPSGVRIPYGETVCVSGYSLHRDESIYADPDTFHYDRFLQSLDGVQENEESNRTLSKTAATTEVDYAVWGHGRHACPGRFFAVNLVKMIIGCIVENYELRLWDERPANFWLGDTPIPPRNVVVGVRRRSPRVCHAGTTERDEFSV